MLLRCRAGHTVIAPTPQVIASGCNVGPAEGEDEIDQRPRLGCSFCAAAGDASFLQRVEEKGSKPCRKSRLDEPIPYRVVR